MKKFFSYICCVLLCAILFLSCEKRDLRTITDRMGAEIKLPAKIERIITSAPSNTEIVVALGLSDKLVAVDTYSADVQGVPPGVTKIDFMNPDGEAVISLNPDIIIANGHNQTGSGSDPFRLVDEAGIAVAYILMSDSIEGICGDIGFVADALNVHEEGEKLIAAFKANIKNLQDKTAQIKPDERQSVYLEISPPPSIVSMGYGTFLDEMIKIAGGINIFADRYGIIFPSGESIIERNPDVIITNMRSNGVFENEADAYKVSINEIKNREGFENIKAIKNGRVCYIDMNSSSRPTHNIVLALNQIYNNIYGAALK
ncbi:MAG: ABC transporter substrate-binding protein [Termitinemataceae bacterium]|nr:MAG: ABC transporter substrate-binding protein [Termitinemataceae bacterium]